MQFLFFKFSPIRYLDLMVINGKYLFFIKIFQEYFLFRHASLPVQGFRT